MTYRRHNDYYYFQNEIQEDIPLIIYGSMAVLVGAWSFVLPETLNRKLPNTIEDLIATTEK